MGEPGKWVPEIKCAGTQWESWRLKWHNHTGATLRYCCGKRGNKSPLRFKSLDNAQRRADQLNKEQAHG